MPLRLKTKFTLTTSLLVLGVAAPIASLYVASLVQQVVREADERARFVAQQVFLQAQHALEDAALDGAGPASTRPEDVHEYVRQTLDENAGLTSLIDAVVGYSPVIYEVTVVDHRGAALISSDSSLPGRPAAKREELAQLTQAGFLDQLVVLYGSTRVYEVRLPFNLEQEFFGDIRVALSTGLLKNQVTPSLRTAAYLALGAVLVSTVLAAAVSHMSLAPLAKISSQLDQIARGNFDLEPLQRRDELGQVSTKISQIGRQLREGTYRTQEERSLAHIQTQIQLLERMAALGRLTAGAAHEVKNPLNSMRLWIENLKEGLTNHHGPTEQALKVLDSEIDRLDGVVKRLLDFYRPADLRLEETNLVNLLREALDIVRPQLASARVELSTDFAHDVPTARVDRQMVKQAVLNLLLNALEAMERGGTLRVTLERQADMAVITVADTGRGIAPEHQGKIFQLFFTTRPDGNGIGLASVFKTVQYHGGSVDFTSEAGRGTTFRIELPLAS